VVEVGVDVPDATVMVVEGADRFGLAQLHQLRGRVGRGTRPSWCVLRIGGEVGASARRRLNVLCRHNDGFAVAEADLALRGPGDPAGRHQSGRLRFRFADLVRDRSRLATARSVAARLADDGRLDEVAAVLSELHPPTFATGAAEPEA
jgi:ATP-dependent DNA helicase RecG